MKRLIVGALVVVATLAFGACGDDDESETGSPTSSEPAATLGSPPATPTPAASEPLEVSFVGAEGDIWVVAAEGGEPTVFADTGDECPNATEITWSPGGEYVACFGFDPATSAPAFAVYGPEGDVVYSEASEISGFGWNPDGTSFAYTVSASGRTDLMVRNVASGDVGVSVADAEAPQWASDGRLAAYRPTGADIGGSDTPFLDIYEGAEATAIPGDYRPLAWVLDGEQILVASNWEGPDDFGNFTFEASLLDPSTETTTRVPELDSRAGLFWVSPNGATAVFVQPQAAPPELAVIDFASLTVIPIADSTIGYPSEFIPTEHVAFATDSHTVYWADVTAEGDTTTVDVYAATLDGTAALPLAAVAGAVTLEFSPDQTQIAYLESADAASLFVSNIDGSGVVQASTAIIAYAWRPLP